MKRFSSEEKAMWLEDWRQSGKNAWAYAKENGLIPQTFTRWTKPIKKESKQIFVEVSKKTLSSPHHAQTILIEKGDFKIHIPLSIGSAGLRSVMEGLGAAL